MSSEHPDWVKDLDSIKDSGIKIDEDLKDFEIDIPDISNVSDALPSIEAIIPEIKISEVPVVAPIITLPEGPGPEVGSCASGECSETKSSDSDECCSEAKSEDKSCTEGECSEAKEAKEECTGEECVDVVPCVADGSCVLGIADVKDIDLAPIVESTEGDCSGEVGSCTLKSNEPECVEGDCAPETIMMAPEPIIMATEPMMCACEEEVVCPLADNSCKLAREVDWDGESFFECRCDENTEEASDEGDNWLSKIASDDDVDFQSSRLAEDVSFNAFDEDVSFSKSSSSSDFWSSSSGAGEADSWDRTPSTPAIVQYEPEPMIEPEVSGGCSSCAMEMQDPDYCVLIPVYDQVTG